MENDKAIDILKEYYGGGNIVAEEKHIASVKTEMTTCWKAAISMLLHLYILQTNETMRYILRAK